MNEKIRVISAFGRGIDALNNKRLEGFLGISADYPFFQEINLYEYLEKYFESKKLEDYIGWSLNAFDSLSLYTSDWLLHYNLMAFEDMNREVALDISYKISNFIESKCDEVISSFPMGKVKFFRLDISEDKNLNKTIKSVRNYSCQDNRFSQHCLELASTATHNKLKTIKEKYGKEQYKKAVSTAHKYAIDDIALLLHLYKNYAPISISKYEPPKPIKNFLYSNYPQLSTALDLKPEEIGHVQVSVENDKIHDVWYDDRQEKLVMKNG